MALHSKSPAQGPGRPKALCQGALVLGGSLLEVVAMGVLAPVAPPGGPLIVGALPAWFEPLGRPPGEGLASEASAVEAASQEAVALVYLAERVLALGPPALGAADSLELVAPLLGAPAGGALAVGVQCQGDLAGGVPGLGAVPQAVSPLPGALAVKALEAPHVGALALEQSAEEAPGQDGLAVKAGLEAALPLLGEPALAALAVEAGAVGAPVLGAAPAQGPVAQGDLLGVAWAPAVEAVLGPAPALSTPLGAFAQEIPVVEVLDQAGVCHEALSEGAVPLLGEPAVEADALEELLQWGLVLLRGLWLRGATLEWHCLFWGHLL